MSQRSQYVCVWLFCRYILSSKSILCGIIPLRKSQRREWCSPKCCSERHMSGNSFFPCRILHSETTTPMGHASNLNLFTGFLMSGGALFPLNAQDRILQKRQANIWWPAESSIMKTYIVQASFRIHGKFTLYQYLKISHQAPHVNCFCSKWLHECSMFWPRLSLLLLADGTRYLLS